MGSALGIMIPLILVGEAHAWSRAAIWLPFLVVFGVTTVLHLLMGEKEREMREARVVAERRRHGAE
jgi:hypothetical protein